MDEDKYPADSDRRRFVKGVVGGGALIGMGATTGVAVNSLTNRAGAGGGTTQYYGVQKISGPAPRAMPVIPITIEEQDGAEVIVGRWPANYDEEKQIATEEVGDIDYTSSWFQYCSQQTKPGVDPQADQENVFRYQSDSGYDWQSNDVETGAKLKVSDFQDYEGWSNQYSSDGRGKPAAAVWRSEGVGEKEQIPVQVLRSPKVEQLAKNGDNPFFSAATERGFIAWLNKCTHFCCTPSGFASSGYNNADGNIYCQCHQSIYSPFKIVKKTFVALDRPA
jgi:Rieske Fe-S protein